MHVKKGSFYITGPTSDNGLSVWKKAFPQINQLEGREREKNDAGIIQLMVCARNER